ncbi:hypothetical protein [Chachezhania sediminis]|uniref:hypothetical protein n=1 Tax=Chachezhania sediminis TaxID=2599291 RepID=UPI00131DA0A4|nr:hypothetical protein [Chachezhania sediminis]
MTFRFPVILAAVLVLLLGGLSPIAAWAQNGPFAVLWWNANPDEGTFKRAHHREAMATYLDKYDNGALFRVTYGIHRRGGDLARALIGQNYDVVVLDLTERRSRFSKADLEALKSFYAGGHRAIMLDGTLNIRHVNYDRWTTFPGPNGSNAGLLVNQVAAIGRAGGGILIGADHAAFQVSANAALRALVPGARFSGTTNPSTDGTFLGRSLLGEVVTVPANDLLQHWQTIPNQGEAPVGDFTDFLGQTVHFHSLVEAADKPGGGRKRPYISASFDPGAERTAIDSDRVTFQKPAPPTTPEPVEEVEEKPQLPPNMPTRKGPPT